MQRAKSEKNIYVYDTSYLLQDHLAVLRHGDDLNIIPYVVISEMGNFKKGDDEINIEARKFQRWLNEDVFPNGALHDTWYNIDKGYKGRIMITQFDVKTQPPAEINPNLNDDKILWAAIEAKRKNPAARVTLLTHDINLCLKAKLYNLFTLNGEQNTMSMKTALTTGGFIHKKESISESVAQALLEGKDVPYQDITPKKAPAPNALYVVGKSNQAIPVIYNVTTERFHPVRDNTASNIHARSIEQRIAMQLLLDPEIRLISIIGGSGTGKTLLALACALEQKRRYLQIFLSRPIIPLNNKEIGFLPGDVKSKLNPYMEPLWDNLKMIQSTYEGHSKKAKEVHTIEEMVRNEKLLIQPLAYIRGRSINDIYFIVDEAQNLTPSEAKAIITRAGENTKIVFTGDPNQIDTPYLSAESNGLSYLTREIQSRPNKFSAIVSLEQGERSELATWGSLMR